MKLLTGTTEQAIVGQEGRIVLGDSTMAFLSSAGAPATARAAAGYGEVAEVRCQGRRVVVEFKTPGPAWQLTVGSPEEAAWAAEFIGMRHQAASVEPALGAGLSVPVLAQRLGELLGEAAPNVPAASLLLLRGAAAIGASDIHIDPGRTAVISLRVGGQLHTLCRISGAVSEALILRLKAMAGLPSYVAGRPMSGVVSVAGDPAVEARVTAVEAVGGEAVSVRLLTPAPGPMEVGDLGLEGEQREELLRAVRRAGLAVFSGPAGAGKTTTMYALVGYAVGQGAMRAVTVEQPPERDLAGAVQIDVEDLEGDWTAGLVAALRLDPEVIAVGEIHDEASATAAARAGLTGHSVLTTLHAGATYQVPVRLLQLGVEPYALASTLNVVVGQRLVRKVCEQCAEEYRPGESVLKQAGLSGEETAGWRLRRGRGCEACGETGYAGRTACFEVWTIDESVRELILRKAAADEFRSAFARTGSMTARQAALEKAKRGETTIEEVARVFGGGAAGA